VEVIKMGRNRTNLWLSPKSKRILKSRAAIEGVTLERYVDRVCSSLENKTETQDRKNKTKRSDFDII